MWRRERSPVPTALEGQITEALEAVDRARAQFDAVRALQEPLAERQRARAELKMAFDSADQLLRRAVSLVRSEASGPWQGSFVTWSKWRNILSRLDAQRQAYMFAVTDDLGVLPVGSVRAVDYGMAGPAIGDIQHRHTRPPGTPARIGVVEVSIANAARPELTAA